MKEMMNLIMLSCRKATELIERRKYSPLDKIERIQLKMHLSMCRWCSNYNKQSRLIDRLISRVPKSTPTDENTTMLQEKIIEMIKK
jgi:hypothetical protein